MELAIGMMSLLGGTAAAGTAAAGTAAAGTAAATAAGATAAAGTATAAAGASALTMLQGAFTAASVLGSLTSGLFGLADADRQARAAEMQAEDEALAIRRETLKKMGDARVAFAASGVSLASAAPVEASLATQSAHEMGLARTGGRLAAGQIRLRGTAGMLSAATDALGTMGRFAIDRERRGV